MDGAAISVTNNANGKEIATGVINNGKFNFVSPENNLSFTAKVSADYGNNFNIIDRSKDDKKTIVEIGFTDTNNFNMT
ncbi:MAG: hypothetical protein LBI57_01465 [Helicobacteraceae bacterium]|nr:hypothetical protein [Helicobacteraceae bacterium]